MTYFKIHNDSYNCTQLYKCDGVNYWFTHPAKNNKWTMSTSDLKTPDEVKRAFDENGVKYEIISETEAFLEVL